MYSRFDITGKINDTELDGSFVGFYDPNTNINGGVIETGDVIGFENTILAVSNTSAASWNKCLFSAAHDGAVNLISVMGLPIEVEIEYSFVDPSGSDLGGIHQTGAVDEVGHGQLRGSITINGTYGGPTDLCWSPGYPVLLRQIGPGQIEGVYGQTIFSSAGERVYVLSRRNYSYHTDRVLPFDEIWSYRLLSLDIRRENGRRKFDYRATAHYVPATGDHGSIEAADRAFAEMRSEAIEMASTR